MNKIILTIIISMITACDGGGAAKAKFNAESLPETYRLVTNEQRVAVCLAFNQLAMKSLPHMKEQLMLNNSIIWAIIDDNKNIDGNSIEGGVITYGYADTDTIMHMARQSDCKTINQELIDYLKQFNTNNLKSKLSMNSQ